MANFTALGRVNTMRHASCLARGVDRTYRNDPSLRNCEWNRDLEQSSGLISPIKVDPSPIILNNLLGYRKAQSATLGLSVGYEGFKSGAPNRRGNARAVIPDANLQAGSISGGGYDDLPRVSRNRLASIQDKIGDHPFEAVGIEPTYGSPFMMMLDGDAAELLFHACHPDRPLDGVNDVSCAGPKRVTPPGALQQRGDQLIHPVDRATDFLVKLIPFDLANMWLGEKFRIYQDGGQGMAKIVGNQGDHPAYGGKRLQNW